MKRMLTSFFGLGLLPIAPGTWASATVAAIMAAVYSAGATTGLMMVAAAVLAVAGTLVTIFFSADVVRIAGRDDPGEIVADEVAGQGLCYFVLFGLSGDFWALLVGGFLLFRLFDILKPCPLRRLERLEGGWGIVADDLGAGLYAVLAFLLLNAAGVTDYLRETITWSQGNTLGIAAAAVLGTVQGLTEFLPVSSSGHLVLFEHLFDFDPEKPAMLLFDLAVHVGTVTAILIVFRRTIRDFLANLLSSGKYGANPIDIYKRSPSVHFLVLAVFTTGVTGVVGLLFKEYFEEARGQLPVVAGMWVITASVLIAADMRKKTRVGLRKFGFFAAGIVGLAQAAAIMPGISRSGATICAAILIGLHRRWAVEYSFLIAIPAILGAALVEGIGQLGPIAANDLSIGAFASGTIFSTVVGVGALKLLIKVSRSSKLKYFAFYCLALAGVVTVWLLSKG